MNAGPDVYDRLHWLVFYTCKEIIAHGVLKFFIFLKCTRCYDVSYPSSSLLRLALLAKCLSSTAENPDSLHITLCTILKKTKTYI